MSDSFGQIMRDAYRQVLAPAGSAVYNFAGARKDNVLYLGKVVFGITAELFKDVGGVRAVAGAISAVVGASGLFGANVDRFDTLTKACNTFNEGAGSLHAIHRVGEFAAMNGSTTGLKFASSLAFMVKDALKFEKLLENLSLVSNGTADGYFARFSSWSGITVAPKGVSEAFEYAGLATSLANNIADWSRDWKARGFRASLNWERGFKLGYDITKLGAIALANGDGKLSKALRYGSLIGTSLVGVGRAADRYFKQQRV